MNQGLRIVFSISIILLNSIFAYPQTTLVGEHDILIPYKKKNSWGLCTQNKKVIVGAKYIYIDYKHPYYFCVEENAFHFDIISSNGKLIDTCQTYFLLDTHRCIILKSTGQIMPSDIQLIDTKTAKYREHSRLQEFIHDARMYEIVNDKLQQLTKGTTRFVSMKNQAWYMDAKYVYKCVITVDGKSGLYDIKNKNFIIQPKYQHLRFVEPYMVVAYNDNKDLKTYNIWGDSISSNIQYKDAVYIDEDNGNYIVERYNDTASKGVVINTSEKYEYELRNKYDSTLVPFNNNWTLFPDNKNARLIRREIRIPGKRRYFLLQDTEGNILIPQYQEMNSVFLKHLYEVTDINEEKHKTFTYGIFNSDLKKYIWQDDSLQWLKRKSDMHMAVIEKDTMLYFYDDKGKLLEKIGRYNRMMHKDWNLMKHVSVRKASIEDLNIFSNENYYALRSSKNDAWKIYNQQFEIVEGIEDIQELQGQSNYFAFMHNQKWGICDASLHEILPPLYESIQTDRKYYKLMKDSILTRIDQKTLEHVPGKNYHQISNYQVQGIWMGLLFDANKQSNSSGKISDSVTIDLIDKSGTVLYSIRRNAAYRKYALTQLGDILEYPKESNYLLPTILIQKITGIETELQYQFQSIEETNYIQDDVISLQCYKQEKASGLVDAATFETIIPFGKYNGSTHPQTYKNKLGDEVKGIHIYQRDENEEAYDFGFYSANGIKFWE